MEINIMPVFGGERDSSYVTPQSERNEIGR